MKSFREFLSINYYKDGAYIELKFNEETLKNIQKYFNKQNIPNKLDIDDIHTTLLYSRKGITNYIPTNTLSGEILKPTSLHIWKTQDGLNCLVCELSNPNIIKYHNKLIKYHNASHDYPEFIPHVTFSYDCKNINEDELPLPNFNFVVEKELLSTLDENFIKKK